MIHDKIKNLEIYKGIHKNIDTVIDFIIKNDLKTLNKGINIINDNFYYNRMIIDTIEINKGIFESHFKYLDLHIVIEGDEKIGYKFINHKIAEAHYNDNDDCSLYNFQITKVIDQDNTTFGLFFPNDAHAPKLKNTSKNLDKVVFKIKYD
ncbi:YhcH/YjgK/YiaL family protein [Spiroplasma turonicum]|uniref:YhcH/YjgK/YiaL family protein n=1 Tax=Spiroplasma turonicum TaxID=216946 RepID=A0A0K1P6V3_9MOLU|nr:YhcH/YjgK/YiaL family protein [Spiroplasma turonicum]AKU79949.1 hypothetical protein STURON_00703 [Spiroplasma turonicum]ALX70962.1 hypothetical protein STURO_v1c07030 [Spiroplasma turonicum]